MPRNDEINASINVWFVDAAIDTEPLEQLLIPDERTRARRYRFEADRRRSIVARAALRRLLGDALGIAPRDVPIVVGDNDKPRLDGGALHFNATHSGDLVAIAIAATEVGVDAEQLRPMSDAVAIAERFFSPAEVERVKGACNVDAEFFTIWTMKEAVVKGIGSGIMSSLQSFTTPAGVTTLAPVECGNATFSGWYTMPLGAPEGYRAAVATKSANALVSVREFRF
jgi:4'-phosphopantetheinyl transferase